MFVFGPAQNELELVMKKILLVSVALVATCVNVGAATIAVERGDVWLNQGKGFRPVRGAVEARNGDIVKLARSARAKLLCVDRTAVELGAGVTRVMERLCLPGQAPNDAAGQAALQGGVDPVYVLGGLAVAGAAAGGAVAATSSGGGNNNNAAAVAAIAAAAAKPVSQ